MTASIVEHLPELHAFEPEWRALAEEWGNAFITPEWFFAFLRHYGDDARPFVAVARGEDNELRGLLPLVIAGGRARVLQFAGANLGDMFHPVARPAEEEAVVVACAGALHRRRPEWKVAVFHHVPAGGQWTETFLDASPSSLSAVRDTPVPEPYLPLVGLDWDGFLASRSTSLRKALSYELRRLERSHAVTFTLVERPENVAPAMDRLFTLHDLRWDGRGGSSLATPKARACLSDFARAAFDAGWLRLWSMEIDGSPIAAWLGWSVGGRYAFFQSGFDPSWSRHSPGLLLVAHTIRHAIDQGAAEYDMLLGDETYKARFRPEHRAVCTVAITPAFHPARVTANADVMLRRLARKLPDGARARVRAAAEPILRHLPTSRLR